MTNENNASPMPEVAKPQGLAPSACSADFFEELGEALRILGAKSDLLGTIGSVGETISDEEAVECLRAWNRANRHRKSEAINIVFDGPPGPEAGRFVEVETDDGKSINAGEWIKRPDGYWALRIVSLPNDQMSGHGPQKEKL